MSDDLKLGFVGFGAMPSRMTARLRDAGFAVIAFDPAHGGGEVDGFAMADSPASLAGKVDAILVSEHHKRKLAMAKARHYPAEFPTRLMSKHMGLLLADAGERGASMPSMAAAAQMYAYAGRLRPDDDYASAIGVTEALART